jgi:hypothetical protein
MKLSDPTVQTPDFIDRYFLRRLAEEYHENPKWELSAHYRNAFVETVFIFVVMPVLGVAAFILIAGLAWSAPLFAKDLGSGYPVLIIIAIGAAFLGRALFKRKLSKYRNDTTTWMPFNTEKDRRIIGGQKFLVFLVLILMPFLAIMVLAAGRR